MESPGKNGILSIFRRELKWIIREPSFILMTIVLPLLMLYFFTAMFGQGVPRNISIGVFDDDNSTLSRGIVTRLSSVPSLNINYRVTSLTEGRGLINRGDISALVYIQKDFEKKTERGVPCPVINYYNNESQIVGGTLLRDITATVKSFSTGRLKDSLLKKGTPQPQVIAMSEPIKLNSHVLFNPYVNYMYYIVSGALPTMLQFFIMLCSIYSIGIEIKQGTIGEAMQKGGMNTVTVITGKLLPYTIIFTLMGIFMNIMMFKYLQFPLNGSIHLIIATTFLYVLAYQAIAIMYIGIAGNLLKGMIYASFYASSAFTFAGFTYPLVAMYWPVQVWAKFIPLTYYLNIIVEQAFRGSAVSISARSLFFMTLFLFLPLLVLPRLKAIFSDENKWGV